MTEALDIPKRWPIKRYSAFVAKRQIVTAALLSTEIDCRNLFFFTCSSQVAANIHVRVFANFEIIQIN